MKQFALIFRMDILSKNAQPSEEEMKLYMKQWHKWTKGLSSKNKLVDGNHFSWDGRVAGSEGSVQYGPYVKDKHSIAGYLIVKAKNLDAATKIAQACPILGGKGNTVEVREIVAM